MKSRIVTLVLFFCAVGAFGEIEQETGSMKEGPEPSENNGEAEPVSIPLNVGEAFSKDVLAKLREAGLEDFVKIAEKSMASSTKPKPPAMGGTSIPMPVPTLWIEGSYSNRTDLFYQSWQVDATAWVTGGASKLDPPLIADRLVIWFTSVCADRSKAADNVSRIVLHEYWNNHNAPPPGQGYCVVDKPCLHTAVIVGGKSGYNGVCL